MISDLFGWDQCGHPDRLAARIFRVVGPEHCPCCAFWRGVVVGALLGAVVVALVCL